MTVQEEIRKAIQTRLLKEGDLIEIMLSKGCGYDGLHPTPGEEIFGKIKDPYKKDAEVKIIGYFAGAETLESSEGMILMECSLESGKPPQGLLGWGVYLDAIDSYRIIK